MRVSFTNLIKASQFGDKNFQQLLVCWRKRLPHWLRPLRDLSNAHNLVTLFKDSLGVPAC